MLQFVPIADVDQAAVEQLLDRAFGRDRHGRTAYAVRHGTDALPALSFAAVQDGTLVGSIQCWPVMLESDDRQRIPLMMVGPVAVDPQFQRDGVGRMLMEYMLAAAGDAAPMVLIGDPEYYGRFFGFTAASTGQWRLPGPVERHRLLARGAAVPDIAGLLGPRVITTA